MKNLFILFLLITILLNSNAQTGCDPVTIINVEHEGDGNRITWTPHTSNEEMVISQGGNYSNCAYIGEESGGVYHRFTQEQLSTVNEGTLTQVVFVPTYLLWTVPGHTYTVQIYKGGTWGTAGNRNPGDLITSQKLNNNNLIFNQENTITLETPITIDASKELWMGYFCTNIDSIITVKEPAGIDAGPVNDGFGNIFFYENEWRTIREVNSSANCNFSIKGKVQTVDGATVNISANGNNIASDISGTTYLHLQSAGEKQCYTVEVNCVEGGVSPLSNEFCIDEVGIREQTVNFAIYPNPANNLLTITRSTASKAQVEIYNAVGAIVKYLEINDIKTHINISSLSSGIYVMKLMDNQGVSVQRFVKE
jgi:hypothetical protein